MGIPVVTVKNRSTYVNAYFAASSLIGSVSDPNNYPITYYDFRDTGGDGGYFVLNGVVQYDGTWITVSAADLGNLVYVGGSSAGRENVDVAAWDGYNWSNYKTATVTTLASDLPSITVENAVTNVNTSIAAASFIAGVSDPNNRAITYYDFRDEGGDGGYFSYNGVKQADGTWITVSAADLWKLHYVGGAGAGSEKVDVAAADGNPANYDWSYYQAADAFTLDVARPLITAQAESVAARKSIAASSFINTVSDPNNFSITYYDFRDAGGDGGYFSYNGVKQKDETWITVSAANLSKLLYVGAASAGSETVDLAAWNGFVWSNYATATAITTTSHYTGQPTITIRNQSLVELHSILASSLINSVKDPNNDAISYYDFRDDGSDGGYFQLSGVRQSLATWITVAAADLKNLLYVAGSSAGSEKVDVAAWDGHAWSYYKTATITTTAPAAVLPTIVARKQTVGANASIQASAFIASVSDPEKNAITAYDFRDEGRDGGHFELNGVAQADGVWITVSAADLSKLKYVGATTAGAEIIDVAAWDGEYWSDYARAKATTASLGGPSIVAKNADVKAGTSIAGAKLIASTSDSNHHPITLYRFRDDGGLGGHLSLNGAARADGEWVSVAAAHLGNLTYVAGASDGGETIDIAAYDGHAWSSYASAIVTTTGGTKLNPVIALLKNAVIKADVKKLLRNNSLSYTAMLKILEAAAVGGDTAAKFADLKTLAAHFDRTNGIQVSSYVDYIAKAVIDGDPANAHWTGGALTSVALGNLTASANQAHFDKLIEKWFLGGDLPSLLFDSSVSCSYKADTDPLFNNTGLPAVSDINQGDLGDCYLLASLAEIAQDQPKVLKSMITVNGNHTYGVEFHIGHKDVFVTVNDKLPVAANGVFVANTSPDLWSSLIEKAYVQLNEDPGYLDHTSGDQYKLIDGGYADPITELTGRQVTAYDYQNYTLTQWDKLHGVIEKAILDGQEVDFASRGATKLDGETAFVEDHMFSGIGFDSKTNNFIVRNPWGSEAWQTWHTEFEATMQDFYGVDGTLFVASGSASGAAPAHVYRA